MYQLSGSTQAALDYNSTIIGALELSEKKWVLAVQLPGVSRHSRHVLEACGDGLASFVERLRARCAAAVARSPGSFSPMKLDATVFGWRVSLPDGASRST